MHRCHGERGRDNVYLRSDLWMSSCSLCTLFGRSTLCPTIQNLPSKITAHLFPWGPCDRWLVAAKCCRLNTKWTNKSLIVISRLNTVRPQEIMILLQSIIIIFTNNETKNIYFVPISKTAIAKTAITSPRYFIFASGSSIKFFSILKVLCKEETFW